MSQIPVTLRDMFWSDPFFETAWGPDFNLLRQEMVREHRLTWDRFGHSFTDQQEELQERQRQEKLKQCCQHCKKNSYHSATDSIGSADDMSSDLEPKSDFAKEKSSSTSLLSDTKNMMPWFLPPRRWLGPTLRSGDDLFKTVGQASQIMRVREDENSFEVAVDTHEYYPDEIKVQVLDSVLLISAKHEEKSEDGTSHISRQFARSYVLPLACEAGHITSDLSSDGVLMIRAIKNPNALSYHGKK